LRQKIDSSILQALCNQLSTYNLIFNSLLFYRRGGIFLEDLRPFLKIKILFAVSNTILSLRITSILSGSLPDEIFELSLKIKERRMTPVV